MPESPAQAPEALTELPLFPLGTVLFPGALLPLQLFELRYLQMIGECERQGTGFGVVTLTQGREVHRPGEAAEQFERMGTRVQIERIERPQAGLVLVWCRGVDRFHVHNTTQRSDGLWLGQVQALPPEPPPGRARTPAAPVRPDAWGPAKPERPAQRGAALERSLAPAGLQLAVQPLWRIAAIAAGHEIPPVRPARALVAAGADWRLGRANF